MCLACLLLKYRVLFGRTGRGAPQGATPTCTTSRLGYPCTVVLEANLFCFLDKDMETPNTEIP